MMINMKPMAAAIWGIVPLDGGTVQHVRIPVSVVAVTPTQAFLGLGG